MSERESRIEQALRVRLKALGCLFYKWVSPGNVGVPDRIIITPTGAIIFVELKTDHGRLSPMQMNQIRKLEKCRAQVFVIYGRKQMDALLDYIEHLEAVRDVF